MVCRGGIPKSQSVSLGTLRSLRFSARATARLRRGLFVSLLRYCCCCLTEKIPSHLRIPKKGDHYKVKEFLRPWVYRLNLLKERKEKTIGDEMSLHTKIWAGIPYWKSKEKKVPFSKKQYRISMYLVRIWCLNNFKKIGMYIRYLIQDLF